MNVDAEQRPVRERVVVPDTALYVAISNRHGQTAHFFAPTIERAIELAARDRFVIKPDHAIVESSTPLAPALFPHEGRAVRVGCRGDTGALKWIALQRDERGQAVTFSQPGTDLASNDL